MMHAATDELVAKVAGEASAVGEYLIGDAGKFSLPVKIFSDPPNREAVVFCFHGAVDQKKRKLPVFFGGHIAADIGKTCTVISIADPGLRLDKDILYTWYAGDHEILTQRMVSALCGGIAEALGDTRIVFLAGSTGAHPALLHSQAIDRSICVVVNPLPRIGTYTSTIQSYASVCWPGKKIENVFAHMVADDIVDRYAAGYSNTVIILQNCTDPHLHSQVIPLAAALRGSNNHLFLNEYFADHIGHRYPVEPWLDWVRAVTNLDANDVLTFLEHAKRNGAAQPEIAVPIKTSAKKAANDQRPKSDANLKIAAMIARDFS